MTYIKINSLTECDKIRTEFSTIFFFFASSSNLNSFTFFALEKGKKKNYINPNKNSVDRFSVWNNFYAVANVLTQIIVDWNGFTTLPHNKTFLIFYIFKHQKWNWISGKIGLGNIGIFIPLADYLGHLRKPTTV